VNGLENLRDIHEPSLIGWWPLAPGWYVVLIAAFIVGAFVGRKIYRRWRQVSLKRYALAHLDELAMQFQASHQAEIIQELSVLLRRLCLAYYSRHQIAGLSGDDWLRFLDRTGSTRAFSQGTGRLLLTAPYQKTLDDSAGELFDTIKLWLKEQQ
tara:strand:+ start:6870 stop:7331 length:462 start_codon:yes stop_codon:yes gene_type:complete